MSRPRHPRGAAGNIAAHHRDWLSLVEISGPFLSLPVPHTAGLDSLAVDVAEHDTTLTPSFALEEVAQGQHDKRKGGTAKRRDTSGQDGLFQT